jgi:hypothetical protein
MVASCYLNARADDTVGCPTGLLDNGKEGDKTAGDGVFVGSMFRATTSAQPGPRLLRFWAETKDAEDRRRATAVQVRNITIAPK